MLVVNLFCNVVFIVALFCMDCFSNEEKLASYFIIADFLRAVLFCSLVTREK